MLNLREPSSSIAITALSATLRLPVAAFAIVLAALLAAFALSTSPALAQQPPAAPTGLSATAGDGSVTLSWNGSSDSSITGYEYSVNHNDTGTGNLTGWGSWQSISRTTSHTVRGLTNGKEYRFKLRAVNAHGASKPAPASSPWYVSATPRKKAPTPPTPTPTPVPTPIPTPIPTPPDAPSSVSVTRGAFGQGVIDVSWTASSGAAHYNVRSSEDNGQTWTDGPGNVAGTSATVTGINDALPVIAAVQAVNAKGASGWTQSPVANVECPPGEFCATAPDTPSSVTVTRADGTLTASWPAVDEATSYHVTYTVNGSGNWLLADLKHTGNSITISGVDNAKTYVVAARARNLAGYSGWRNSAPAGPYVPTTPARPTGLTATAGDGSVTLAWDDPSDSTITGYEYQSRQAPPAPGWGDWTAVAGNVTTVTVMGLTNGTEYRFKLRAVNAAGAGKPSGPPWYVAATPMLTAPSNVAVQPSASELEITWDAVSGATSYDVRAKAEGASDWHDVASGVAGTSYTYATTSTMDYVAVRARSANGASAWTEASRLPPDDLLPIATGITSGGASAQSVQAQSTLAAPTWGTITRVFAGGWDIALKLNWTGPVGATGYNVVCSNYGWYWYTCGWDDDGTLTFTSVPSGESQPVKFTHTRRVNVRYPVQPGDYTLDIKRHYTVAIRAVNGSPSQKSAWVSSPRINPLVGIPEKIAFTRTDGQIDLSWKPGYWTTDYDIYCDTYTPNVPHNPSYTLCATLSNVSDSDASHGVTITTWTDDGTNYAIDNTSIYDIIVYSKDQWTKSGRYVHLIHPNPTLGVSAVGATGATLTVYGHTGNWWYKGREQPTGSYGNCTQVTGATSVTLSGLNSNIQHQYHAYSATGCADADLIANANFRTLVSSSGPAIAVTNLTQTTARITLSGHTGNWWYENGNRAVGPGTCTAGPSNFIVNLSGLTKDTEYGFNVYNASTCATGARLVAGGYKTSPASTLTASNVKATTVTLTLSDHSGDWWHQGTERGATQSTCTKASGATVDLTGLNPGKQHTWGAFSASTCATDTLLDSVSFTTPASLAVSDVTGTTATLTITGHSTAWHYKANAAPDNTCKGPVTAGTSTKDLANLTGSTTYTYEAFSDSACTTANKLASVTFTASNDYDSDEDGLIEIGSLAQLNAVRWDLDGNGTASGGNTTTYAAAFPHAKTNMGCNDDEATPSACTGYELSADLDFDTNGNGSADSGDTYWNSGAGWSPIGAWSGFFTGTFDGGGYKLSNLHVNASTTADDATPDHGGLFGRIGKGGAVKNLGLEDVSVTVSSTLEDAIHVGALAADNRGTVTSVWSSGSVTGSTQRTATASWVNAGGLVGRNDKGGSGSTAYEGIIRDGYSKATIAGKGASQTSGTEARAGGLVGTNKGTIAASFATGSVSAETSNSTQSLLVGDAGGLVGQNNGTITASYATGAVNSDASTVNAGGLVGENTSTASVAASYSTGAVTGVSNVGNTNEEIGGLVGKSGGTVTNSYWDTTTSGKSTSGGGTGKTTSELQTPTGYTGIYANWNVNVDGVTGNDDPWDFGTSSQYPILDTGYPPVLTVSAVTSTGATLTLSLSNGAWHYKATSGPHTACQSAVNTSSASLTGLSAGTAYTYDAYSDSACTDANKLATASSFTTLISLAASNIAATTATLTIAGHSNDWYYKANAAPDNTCQGPVTGSSTKDLTGLSAGTAYTYDAYSDSACTTANKLATATFTTLASLTASNIGATTATLTIAGHSTDWHYKANAAPHTACQSAVSTSSTDLTGLSANTSYTYEAYSDSACTTANKLATAAAFTTLVGLTASNIGETTATLTIAGHNAAWYYDADTGPHTTCQGPVATNTSTKDITGLSANTTYTYEAYSASGCADTDKLATAAAFTTLPGLPRNVSVANSSFSGNNRRYPVSWDKPANTEATDTFAYQVQCTNVNDKTTTSWGACGTQNVASTANTDLSLTVSHGWSAATFKYVRVRTVKDGRNSAWVIRHTQYGTP